MRIAIVVVLSCILVILANTNTGSGSRANPAAEEPGTTLGLSFPMAFVPNEGQWDKSVEFASTQGRMTTVLQRDRIAVGINSDSDEEPVRTTVALRFTDTSPDVELEAYRASRAFYNFFLGNDESRWKTKVPGYAGVRYRGLRDGVDLIVQEGEAGLRYDLELMPGAEVEGLIVEVEGAESLRLDDDGKLLMATVHGEIAQSLPVAWQTGDDGTRYPVDCRFRLIGPRSYGFEVVGVDPALTLTIDPTLQFEEYATFLPGGTHRFAWDVVQDEEGFLYFAGITNSIPDELASEARPLPGYGLPPLNPNVGVLAKLDPGAPSDGDPSTPDSLVYFTVFGGSEGNSAGQVALGPDSTLVVYGSTWSPDFPVTVGDFTGEKNAYVMNLDADDSNLIFSTLLGGPDTTANSRTLDVDVAGRRIYVGGFHVDDGTGVFPDSTNHHTYGAVPDAFPAGGRSVWLAVLDFMGQIVGTASIGGASSNKAPTDLMFDSEGNIYVLGFVDQEVGVEPYFPTTAGAFKSIPAGEATGGRGRGNGTNPVRDQDGFLVRLSPSLSLDYSTLIGGDALEYARDLSTDGNGRVFVAGKTNSPNFPMVNPIDTIMEGSGVTDAEDAFLQEYDFSTFVPEPGGVPPIRRFSSFFGPDNTDDFADRALYANGLLFVYGRAEGVQDGFVGDFPSVGGDPIKSGPQDFNDTFLAVFDPQNAYDLVYSSVVGGSGWDISAVMRVPGDGSLILGLKTESDDLVTTPNAILHTRQMLWYLMKIPMPFGPPVPRVAVSPFGGLVTTELGDTDSFDVVLTTQPAANVTIGVSSSDTSEGTVAPSSLTFTALDWDEPQSVTVTGEDDPDLDGDIRYAVLTAATVSADPDYNGLGVTDVSVTNVDNEGPVPVTVDSVSPTVINAGNTNLPFMVFGTGFDATATITFENGSGPAPQVTEIMVMSPTEIAALISVSNGGPKGSRLWDVRVTNLDTTTDVLPAALTVAK